MLGKAQRWFAKDHAFTTRFDSAAGLSSNMAVQYRGFSIGNVKSFVLAEDDQVDVVFVVYENFLDRVRLGSVVELSVSPIGMGNKFLFHPGLGEPLQNGAFVPAAGSPEALDFADQGLASAPRQDDSMSLLVSRASVLLETVNTTLLDLDNAFKGNDATSLGRLLGSVEEIVSGNVNDLTGNLNVLLGTVNKEVADLKPILANIEALTTELNQPDGLVYSTLDGEGKIYGDLVNILGSVSGIAKSLDKTMAFLPGQLPQVAGLLQDLRVTLKSVEDVLVALTNNPLLRNGVPKRIESQPAGMGVRDVSF
jgi:phospholipid/cholesterol/gamma-HCH transport system substrate-binding protein